MPSIEELVSEVAALRRRIEASESTLAIHALKARYAALVDRRFSKGRVVDRPTLDAVAAEAAQLFTTDAVWDGGPVLGRVTGRPAIADRLAAPTLAFARHFFVQPQLEVDGDTARGRWELLSPCRTADGVSSWMFGYEDDEYACVDGVWLHRSMTLTTVVMAPVADGWERVLA